MKSNNFIKDNCNIGFVSFIIHFHQPYWQSEKVWNQVKIKSYIPWAQLLSEMVDDIKFNINLHFSGPFLIQMYQKEKEYLKLLKKIIKNPRINLISGFIDEAFIQLSSRPDDVYYQLKEYLNFSKRIFTLQNKDFFGIHIVEREISERLIHKISLASWSLGLTPLIYLDAETFFESKIVSPGDSKDLYFKFFNAKDPVHRTVFPFIPKEGLFFLFRDEIEGVPFYCVPIHSIFRYKLLKRNKRNSYDKIITPEKYLELLIKEKNKVVNFAQKFNTNVNPIIIIFTDAECLGQWSGDPQGDLIWMKKLFHLIEENEELELKTLNSYYKEKGYLDTYPINTSNSYPEFIDWSGDRGIRGIILADPKFRKVYYQTIQLERFQERIEKIILKKLIKNINFPLNTQQFKTEIFSNFLISPHRFELIQKILKLYENPYILRLYIAMNRLRNISYIEDGKWATRHPCFGNQPHLDTTSLTYLDLAEFIGYRLLDKLNIKKESTRFEILDWNKDKIKEIILQNLFQKIIISERGGHIIFHQIRSNKLINASDKELMNIIDITMNSLLSNSHLSTNICFTEPDSELQTLFTFQNSRKEECRDSFRIEIFSKENKEFIPLGNFSNLIFEIENKSKLENLELILNGKKRFYYNKNDNFLLYIKKKYQICHSKLRLDLEVEFSSESKGTIDIFIVPELVFTLLPSDGLHFMPDLSVDFIGPYLNMNDIIYNIETSHFKLENNKLQFINFQNNRISNSKFQSILIVPTIIENNNEVRTPKISINPCVNVINRLEKLEIRPAIKNFYQNVIKNENSLLNYHTSGLMIRPYIKLSRFSKNIFTFTINYDLDENFTNKNSFDNLIKLIEIKKITP